MSKAGRPLSPKGVRLAAIELGIATRGGDWDTENLACPETRSEIQKRTLAALDSRDIDYNITGPYEIKECAPIERRAEPFVRDVHWRKMRKQGYEQFIESNGPTIRRDDAGTGKTTNVSLGALSRGRPHIICFDKHEKAYEHRQKDIVQKYAREGYFHLKGGSQPRYDCCLEATFSTDSENPVCPTHGPEDEWERMCPLYNQDSNSDIRQRFEQLSAITSYREAHDTLCPAEECSWATQFDGIEDHDRIVGVHPHQLLPMLRDTHDIIIDESPTSLSESESWSTEDLRKAADILRLIPGALAEFLASFTEKLLDAVLRGDRSKLDPSPTEVSITGKRLAKIKLEFHEFLQMSVVPITSIWRRVFDGNGEGFD